MDIAHSPTGNGKNIELSGSQPNLSTMDVQDGKTSKDLPKTTLRNRRKYCPENDVNNQLADIQKQINEMMTLLTTSINTQKEYSTKITSDIASIKNEMLEIKSSIGKTQEQLSTINTDHEKMKINIQDITSATGKMEVRIASLESNVLKLETSQNNSHNIDETMHDDVVTEIREQILRKNNIILAGIPEPQSNDYKERRKQDKEEVFKVITSLSKDCPEPTKVTRIGKYKADHNRAIKVHFALEQTAKMILQNRKKLKESTIKIFPDQTPFQQARFKKVKDELNRRITNGEDNIQIKHIKGIPKIVASSPKNPKF